MLLSGTPASSSCAVDGQPFAALCDRGSVMTPHPPPPVGTNRLCTLYATTHDFANGRTVVADIEAGVQTVLQPWLASPSSTAVADAAVQDLATDLVRCGWFHVAVGNTTTAARLVGTTSSLLQEWQRRSGGRPLTDVLPPALAMELRCAAVAAAVPLASVEAATPSPPPVPAGATLDGATSEVLWWHAMLDVCVGATTAAPHHALVHTAMPTKLPSPSPSPSPSSSSLASSTAAGPALPAADRASLAAAGARFLAASSRLRAIADALPEVPPPPYNTATAQPWSHASAVRAALAHVQLNAVECGWGAVSLQSESKHLAEALKAAEAVSGAAGHGWRLGRPLLLLARTHHDASHAVTAEGLYRAAGDAYGKAIAGVSRSGVASLPMVARLQWVNALRWHATLLEEWERREGEAAVLRARADEIAALAVHGLPSGSGSGGGSDVASLLAYTPWGF